jgi:hypothetical protein
VSGADLRRIIEKVGTSIAAITKEVELEKVVLAKSDSATA